MDTLTAHAMFAMRPDAGLSAVPADVAADPRVLPAAATAACSLSGWLADAATDADLDAAAEQCGLLLGAGVVSVDDLNRETLAVIATIANDPTLAAHDRQGAMP